MNYKQRFRDICINMFIVALFTIHKKVETIQIFINR